MLLIGIGALLFCYLTEFIVCFLVMKCLKADSMKIGLKKECIEYACNRTVFVIAMAGVVYFIPLIGLVLSLAFCPFLIGFIILLIFTSTYFVTKYILIPISEKYDNKK